jgi:hypothetical protein
MMPDEGVSYTLIGDVIGSREASDRRRLQVRLGKSLKLMNELLKPAVPLETTVGDEFQASLDSAADAVWASLLLRLEIFRQVGVDTRYGLGAGPVEIFTRRRPIISQDGPGWWSARDAIDTSKRLGAEPRTAYARTTFTCSREAPAAILAEEPALNAFLLCRDAMVSRMNPKGRNRLYGALRGRSQAEIADMEGTTQPAISQSLARSDAFAILISQQRLEGEIR